MENIFVMYGIALLSIILGFIALLTQKTYIDCETNQPTELEVPFLGKMKTNMPALVFVIIGFVLSYVTFDKSYEMTLEKSPPRQVEWTITGSFEEPVGDTTEIDWRRGSLYLLPNYVKPNISDKGTFMITAEVDEGKTFEEVYDAILFTHDDANAQILTKKEYTAYVNKQESLIEDTTKTLRKYKPKLIELAYK
jgi:hypothetical protein